MVYLIGERNDTKSEHSFHLSSFVFKYDTCTIIPTHVLVSSVAIP